MEEDTVHYLHSRYKIGTKAVVDWLVATARQRCDLANVLRLETIATQEETTKRTKSGKKARNKKEKAKSKEALHVELSSSDLLRLSDQITAAAGPSTKAPQGLDDVVRLLGDVIKGRRECAEWHKDGDAGHIHFVETLQQVLHDLRHAPWPDRLTKQDAKSSKGSPSSDIDSNIHNAFLGLAIEDPGAMPLGQSPITPHKPHAQLPKNTTFTLKEDFEDEKTFAIWCFFKQGQDIRNFIKSVWREYIRGQCALQVASQVTSAAANLLKDSAKQLSIDYPDLTTFEDLAKHLRMRYVVAHGTPVFLECMASRRSADLAATDEPEMFCTRAFVGALLVKEWQKGAENPAKALEASLHARSYHVVLQTYVELNTDLRELLDKDSPIGGVDPFLCNLAALMKQARPDIATIVLIETEMCISDVLGRARRHVYSVLSDMAKHIESAMDCTQSFIKSTAAEGRPLFRVGGTMTESDLRRIIKEGIPLPQSSFAASAEKESSGTDSKYVLARMPLTAGALAMKLQTFWHMDTVPTANHHYLIQSMAHLYRALRNAGLITTIWRDMETVIESQGASKLGLRDTDPASFSFLSAAKQYGLAFGVTAHAFAKQRQRRRATPRVYIPALRLYGPHHKTLKTLRADNQPNMKHTSPITKALWGDGPGWVSLGTTSQGTTQGNLHSFVSRLLADSSNTIEDEIRDEWTQFKRLTPIQLLSLTKQSLQDSELGMNFEYMRLFEGCDMVFQALLLQHIDAVTVSQIAEDIEPSQEPRHAVDELLWGAALEEIGAPRLSGACGLKELHSIASFMQDWIKNNGSCCYAAALSKTSGNLPEKLIPQRNLSVKHEVDSVGLFQRLRDGKLEFSSEVHGVPLPVLRSRVEGEEMQKWHREKPRSEQEVMSKIRELVSELAKARS